MGRRSKHISRANNRAAAYTCSQPARTAHERLRACLAIWLHNRRLAADLATQCRVTTAEDSQFGRHAGRIAASAEALRSLCSAHPRFVLLMFSAPLGGTCGDKPSPIEGLRRDAVHLLDISISCDGREETIRKLGNSPSPVLMMARRERRFHPPTVENLEHDRKHDGHHAS
jgi:hypothetical protein